MSAGVVWPKSRVLGMGCYVPRRAAGELGGVAGPEEATSDLAVAAAQSALEDAGLSVADVQMIVMATTTGDSPMPATAATVQKKLGAELIPSFDVNASGAGFLVALSIADQFIAAGSLQKVLVVGAEIHTRHQVSASDGLAQGLFGDAAGAWVLGPSEETGRGVVGTLLRTDSRGVAVMRVPGGGSAAPMGIDALAAGESRLHVDGAALDDWSVTRLVEAAQSVLQSAGVDSAQLARVVLLPGGSLIRDAVQSALGLPPERVLSGDARDGNLGAAAMPVALLCERAAGRLSQGDLVLLCALGAGITWGAALVRL